MKTQTGSKHTPTPFVVVPQGDYYRIAQKNGFLESEVATCLRKENAAFIVRAVNRDHAFEGLLSLLKEWEQNIPRMWDETPLEASLRGRTLKAIAEAEGN